jgi:hypothetical protein
MGAAKLLAKAYPQIAQISADYQSTIEPFSIALQKSVQSV